MIEYMSRRYDQRIYNQRLKELKGVVREEREVVRIVNEVNGKIEKLESRIKN